MKRYKDAESAFIKESESYCAIPTDEKRDNLLVLAKELGESKIDMDKRCEVTIKTILNEISINLKERSKTSMRSEVTVYGSHKRPGKKKKV